MRDTIAPEFTSIKNNRCNKSLKEEFLHIYIYNFLFSFIIDKCKGDGEGREQGKNGKL